MRRHYYYNPVDPQTKGAIGESEVAYFLSGFNVDRFTIINNVLLEKPYARKDSIPTVQIDHVIVSIFGIFVIETKNYSGSIYGQENADMWHVYLSNQKYDVPNPLKQNYSHTKTLQQLILSNAVSLGVQGTNFNIYPIVAFSSNANIKKLLIQGADVVYYHNVPQAILNKCTQQVLTPQQVASIANFINSKNIYTPENMQKHIQSIQNKQADKNSSAWDMHVNAGSYGAPAQQYYPYMQGSENLYNNPGVSGQFRVVNSNFQIGNVSNQGTISTDYYQTAQGNNFRVPVKNQQPKKKNKTWIILLSVFGGLLLHLIICCGIGCLGLKDNNNTNKVNNGTPVQSTSVTKTNRKITTLGELSKSELDGIRKVTDAKVDEYVESESKIYAEFEDTLKDPEFVGCCLKYDSSTYKNCLYMIYKISEDIVVKDTIKLIKHSDEREFFYYISVYDLKRDKNNVLEYNNTTFGKTEKVTPTYAGKTLYSVIGYRFSHPGYMFYSDLKADLDSIEGTADYDVNSIKVQSPDEMNILMDSDNVSHGSIVDLSGYKDGTGEEYNICAHIWCHNAFTDPKGIDYHVGKDYSKLCFTYTIYKDSYSWDDEITITLIDIDTYEVFYTAPEKAKDSHSVTAEVDITGHENVRIQMQESGGAPYVLVKDVILKK